MQEWLKRRLDDLWDAIEISEVLGRVYKVLSSMQNDFIFNIVWFASMCILALGAGFFALKFDYLSTLHALDTTREFILKDNILPQQFAGINLVSIVLLAITLAPTLVEFFGAIFAKAQIRVIQLLVIGFTVFDIITDIPTVTQFVMLHHEAIDQFGLFFSWLAYVLFFGAWLILASFGFELALCIFVYAAIFFAGRLLRGGSSGAGGTVNYGANQRRSN